MQHATPSCQLDYPETGDSRSFSATTEHNPQPITALRVSPNQQWISTTTGRITPDPYSWMQAVHWVSGSGLYTPSRNHGPKWGRTTLLIAQEISALTECRPGIAYLARKVKVSERTVQYHLGMLREAGLLVYRSKGTRLTGSLRQASVYERVIPAAFDEALGIRTRGEGVQRRPVGIAQQGRKAIGKLAKKAARKIRKTSPKGASKRGGRCTPMQGGTSTTTSAATPGFPSESKLASGKTDSPTPKSPKKPRRALNRVGRRYQLAGELIAQEPWLARAHPARIAWIVRHVADAGWSCTEIRAFLHHCASHRSDDIRRPSAVLATRLRGALTVLHTEAARRECVDAWRESQTAQQQRHNPDDYRDLGPGPSNADVQHLVAGAFQAIHEQQTAGQDCEEITADTPAFDVEALTRQEVLEIRAAALEDPDVIGLAIDHIGETDARRLYTNATVNAYLTHQETAHVCP